MPACHTQDSCCVASCVSIPLLLWWPQSRLGMKVHLHVPRRVPQAASYNSKWVHELAGILMIGTGNSGLPSDAGAGFKSQFCLSTSCGWTLAWQCMQHDTVGLCVCFPSAQPGPCMNETVHMLEGCQSPASMRAGSSSPERPVRAGGTSRCLRLHSVCRREPDSGDRAGCSFLLSWQAPAPDGRHLPDQHDCDAPRRPGMPRHAQPLLQPG